MPLSQPILCTLDSRSSTQFMSLYPNGPSLYSRPSASLHWFQFSLIISPSLPFSSATYLTPAAFLPTYLLASSLVFLKWISLSQPPNTASLPSSPIPVEVLILPLHIGTRQLSPPHSWGARKRPWTGKQFSFPFSLPAAVPSSAHSRSRHSYGRYFPIHHRLRCFAGMEHAHETLSGLEYGQGQWGIYPQEIWTLKRPASFFIKFEENAHSKWLITWSSLERFFTGKDTSDRKATISYCILNICYKAQGSMEMKAFKNH